MKKVIGFFRIKIMQNIIIALLILLMSSPLSGTSAEPFTLSTKSFDNSVERYKVTIKKLNSEISSLSLKKDFQGLLSLADSLVNSAQVNKTDSSEVADIYYYAGVCELFGERYQKAVRLLGLSIDIKKKLQITDEILVKGLFNLGIAYSAIGDIDHVIATVQDYIVCASVLSGWNSAEVASGYSFLIGESFAEKDYDAFIKYSLKILEILEKNKNAVTYTDLGDLYQNIGAGYSTIGDFSKGRIYLEKAESIYRESGALLNRNYINLINSLAVTYGNLGLNDKEKEYFEKGIELATSNYSLEAFNIINSYALKQGNAGRQEKGEAMLREIVKKVKSRPGADSRFYIQALKYYADYLMNFSNDTGYPLKLYEECVKYSVNHTEDKYLNNTIQEGYAEALYRNGETLQALHIIQNLLFPSGYSDSPDGLNQNPPSDSLRADRATIELLSLKYKILHSLYSTSSDLKVLEAAASTTELIVSILDRMRINISEDESRVVLADRYRSAYLLAIENFELCYKKTSDKIFLGKAFEYAERSKVAGLLAATRELNAIQFHIPPNIATLERSLQGQIGYCNSRISIEYDKEKPDLKLIAELKEDLLSVIRKRDSLVSIFEKQYPGYYALKYNTKVPSMDEIPSITGKHNNYLNYVLSDSMLYIFLVNNKNREIATFRIDSSFMAKLRNFRNLLSDPSASENARTKFIDYCRTGYELYRILVEPLRKYFISDKLIISPDNILSYLPFETLLSSAGNGNELNYRELNYLMNDFSISYTYSAAFMKESIKMDSRPPGNLVVFAPAYTKALNTDSLLFGRQSVSGILIDLPEARQEAEYVSKIFKGKLYLANEAKESVFKKVAGNYGIIHLAMHAFLNDRNPMNSAMIFDQSGDSPEDGLLRTYEVYGLHLNSRMVVLSSCNTGSGKLSSGEGILSLARGFLYSGSRSVVMSMWKIDDKSGTEIVKMFYDNLKKGKSKSHALKSARTVFLKNASQMRSHPYFWASLVVYGDNEPVYTNVRIIIISSCLLLLLAAVIVTYFRKRRYS